jgi:hypothetical protein
MQIENRSTLETVLKRRVSLFLGAGFSTLAYDEQGHELPVGSRLAEDIRKEFNLERLRNLSLQALCTVINSTQEDRLRDYLKQRYQVHTFDERYKVLDRLSIDTIYTTNIDNLVHRIFASSKRKYVNDIDFNGPVFDDKSAVELVMLHGSVLHDRRPLRFGALEVSSSFGADPGRWRDLQSRLSQQPIVFW